MVKLLRLIMLAGVMLAFVSAGSAFAAKGGNSDNTSFLNGKPFATLNADIQVNASGIEALQTETAYLQSTVSALTISIGNLEGTVQLNSDAIADLQDDLTATNQDLQDLQTQVDNHITSVNHSIEGLQGQIEDLQEQVDTLAANLALQLAGLQDAIDANATDISGLLTTVTSLTAQILVVNNTLDNHEDRIAALETSVADLQTALLNIDARLVGVEQLAHTHDDGLCFSFTNTANEDLTDNDWFDNCVAAAEAGGTTVRVVLKDGSDNVVYDASGAIVGQWSQDFITSTATGFWSQYHHQNHDRLITLDNGDILMIPGKKSSNGGCGGSLGNGYGINIYNSNPNYVSNLRMLVQSYKQFVSYNSPRSFYNWTPNGEITWNGGSIFNSCGPWHGSPSTPGDGFNGTFEFYVN